MEGVKRIEEAESDMADAYARHGRIKKKVKEAVVKNIRRF